jgi:hypothetical protein
MTTTYPYEEIAADAAANGAGIVRRILDEGETAWNPASTKTDLVGPLLVSYRQYPDGGWTASVTARES